MFFLHSKRKLKNIRLTKEHQIKYYGWWFIVSILLILLLSACFFLLFEEQWQSILMQNPDRSLEYVFSRSRFVTTLVFVSLLLMIGITILGIFTAHRIAGPFVALRNAFDEVKKGNFDHRIQFRKEDELAEIQSSFNEMMDTLKEKLR